jgi:hypothetical protein
LRITFHSGALWSIWIHLRVVLPAREIQALAQRAGEIARRVHLEAVAQALAPGRLREQKCQRSHGEAHAR